MFNLEIIATYRDKSARYTLKGDGFDDERLLDELECPEDEIDDIKMKFINIPFECNKEENIRALDAMQSIISDKILCRDIIETVFEGETILRLSDVWFLEEQGRMMKGEDIDDIFMSLGAKKFEPYLENIPQDYFDFIDFHGIGKECAEDFLIIPSSIYKYHYFVIEDYR